MLDDHLLIPPAEDFEAAKAKALKVGAIACYVEDIREEFVRLFLVKWRVVGNVCFPKRTKEKPPAV